MTENATTQSPESGRMSPSNMIFNTLFALPKTLSDNGVIGMNSRNGDIILPLNPRKSYPLVDDKIQTKKLALAAGLPVPALYGLIESVSQVKDFAEMVKPYREFVIKPARGSGGGGIVVVKGHSADRYQKANGKILTGAEIHVHIQNALGGAFSLGGGSDAVLIEYCVQNAPVFEPI